MKKILFIATIISFTCKAQVYKKLLADSITEFDVVYTGGLLKPNNSQQTFNSCLYPPNVGIWYAINDSTYKNKVYKKILNYSSFQGLMREDSISRKVYFMPFCDTTEILLYDFSLQQGDTIRYNLFNSSFGLITGGVFTVDSIRTKHDYKNYSNKHSYLRNHITGDSTLEIVEGVGSVTHPLFLYSDFGYGILRGCTSTTFDNVVSCKWNNGNKVYFDSCAYLMAVNQGNCFNTLDTCNYYNQCGGIEKEENSSFITIYPNPSNGNFVLETSIVGKQTLQVFDVNGKLVLLQSIDGKTNVDVSNLNEGIYNLSLMSNNAVLNKRFVIVR